MSLRSRSRPTTYQRPSSLRRAYGLSVRSFVLSLEIDQYSKLHRPLLRDRVLELREAAGRLGRVVGVEHLDAAGRLGRRLDEAGPSEREVLQREAQRLRVRELPLEEIERGLERGELLVLELELGEEVLLGAEHVQLLARELVALRLQRHAEREELRAVGVEAPRERLVGHLGVALDVRLDVASGDRPALRHQIGDERELPDQLVGVVRHPLPHPTKGRPVDRDCGKAGDGRLTRRLWSRGAGATGSSRVPGAACAGTACPCASSPGSARRRRRGAPTRSAPG